MEKYDLCVIGAGPSGYAAAMRALDFNKKVIIIEKKKLGGTGIWNGALSSKTWWELAREAATVRKHLQKYHQSTPELNFRELANEVKNAVYERSSLLMQQLRVLNSDDHDDLFTYVSGKATLVTEHEVMIQTEAEETLIYAENVILATGSRPRKLEGIPIDEEIIMTSDGIEHLEDFPQSIVILGAGVIGCEFATIFSNFGYTKVHLIDKGDRILPFEDEDIVNIIEKNLEANGVLIHRSAHLIRMEIVDGKVEYELEYNNGKKQIYTVEKALVSVGRTPNLEELWTDNLKIEHNDRGINDKQTQTSIPNIYAVGDLTADIALVNIGELEGRHAVERMFGYHSRDLIYENISTIMFLNPEVAGVGLNENQAQKKGINYKVVTLNYGVIPRAVARRNTQGFIKIIVTDDEEMRILGTRVVGFGSSNTIEAIALLISMDKGIEELSELIHPHPSVSEGIQESVRVLLGKSMLKPKAMIGEIACRRHINGEFEDILH